MLRLFDAVGGGPPNNKFLLVGDFVDRGRQSIETITLLLAYKLKFPDRIFLLRGITKAAQLLECTDFMTNAKEDII